MPKRTVTLDEIREFTYDATNVGQAVAYFALAAAQFTSIYKEPGHSIDAVDRELGSKQDVPDPLLSSHRLAKFYTMSAGDALLSCAELVGREFPMLVGSAALARTTAEHASRSMYLSSPTTTYQGRVLRAHALFHISLNEYMSTNKDGARELVGRWEKWRTRAADQLKATPKQPSAKTARGLIELCFNEPVAYDELSRPTHGNAAWMTAVVIQEQKKTIVARILTLRNFEFSMQCTLEAARQICELWDLDEDAVMAKAREMSGVKDSSCDSAWLMQSCATIRGYVSQLDESEYSDTTPDPQPKR